MRRGPATIALDEWRDAARALVEAGVPPEDVAWTPDGGSGLLFEDAAPLRAASSLRVPRAFLALAEDVLRNRDPARHALLYRLLWRLARGERGLLEIAADPDVHAAQRLARQVRRDAHEMTAFVRFRRLADDRYVSWYEPAHHVVRRVAPFFRERFAAMRWAILTPDESVAWDGEELTYGSGVPRHLAPPPDALEELWRTYYASIFNPARANPRVMRQHMAPRHWKAMPETALIPELLAGAPARVTGMIAGPPSAAAAQVPRERSLPALAEAARRCTACELCGPATQAVFGEGPADAPLVLVGEQPGDVEDLTGRPFVGPAGQVLDEALAAVGLDRARLYVTNAVKHFHFEERGKQRIHQKPTAAHLRACRAWLDAELETVRPRAIVCLGVSAAQSFLGPKFRLGARRGEVIAGTRWAEALIATYHPAAILRMPDAASRAAAEEALRADLARALELSRAARA